MIVQGPGHDYVRQTISSWDFNKNAGGSGRYWAERLHVGAYAFVDLKPNQEPQRLNLALRRGVTVKGTIVGPYHPAVDGALILSRQLLSQRADTVRFGSEPTFVKNGRFSLHGLDPDASVPFYFVDLKNETGAAVEISGRSADNGPLVVHMQPCGKAVARFVNGAGNPIAKHFPALMILVTPGLARAGNGQTDREVQADAEFVCNFDRVHYWTGWNKLLLTDGQGRYTFPALIPGATYRLVESSGAKDFTVKSGETLQLPDIVIREAGTTAPAGVGAKAKDRAPANAADAGAWKPGQTSAAAKTAEPTQVVPAPPTSAKSFMAGFPSGITVELLGISGHPSKHYILVAAGRLAAGQASV